MIAAIYARRSKEQNDRQEKDKSVNRQEALAREFAIKKGSLGDFSSVPRCSISSRRSICLVAVIFTVTLNGSSQHTIVGERRDLLFAGGDLADHLGAARFEIVEPRLLARDGGACVVQAADRQRVITVCLEPRSFLVDVACVARVGQCRLALLQLLDQLVGGCGRCGGHFYASFSA